MLIFDISCFLLFWPFFCQFGNAASECKPGELPCDNGECIKGDLWCDDEIDCVDGSDVDYCSFRTSYKPSDTDPNGCRNKTHLFICDNGECIPKVGFCDGTPHCYDKSDEKNCKSIPPPSKHVTSAPVPKVQNIATRRVSHLRPTPAYGSSFSAPDRLVLEDSRRQARSWILSQRNEFGWGEETGRAIVALHLSRSAAESTDPDDDMLMEKQLDVALSVALARNDTKLVSLTTLSLYINAISVTCKNPRNFYGYDLVSILRHRVDDDQRSGNFVTPIVYLTLCLNNHINNGDVNNLQELTRSGSFADKLDMKASALLATSCIARLPPYKNSTLVQGLVKRFVDSIKDEHLPGNVYEMAVIVQALDAVGQGPSEWPRMYAIDFILKAQKENGSFGDILATYYALPILSNRTLLNLNDHCNKSNQIGLTPLEILTNGKSRKVGITYSLRYYATTDVDVSLQMNVAEGTNFLDIMRIAQELNPKYKFSMDNHRDSPLVYSIGDIPNDVEKGMYWILHLARNRRDRSRNAAGYSSLQPHPDISKLVPVQDDRIVFWFKSL